MMTDSTTSPLLQLPALAPSPLSRSSGKKRTLSSKRRRQLSHLIAPLARSRCKSDPVATLSSTPPTAGRPSLAVLSPTLPPLFFPRHRPRHPSLTLRQHLRPWLRLLYLRDPHPCPVDHPKQRHLLLHHLNIASLPSLPTSPIPNSPSSLASSPTSFELERHPRLRWPTRRTSSTRKQ